MRRLATLVAGAFFAASCARGAESHPAGSPVQAVHAHLCGLHFYSGEPKRQMIVHHYCAHVSAGVWQCILYDSARPDARLIGIEYVISEAHFRALPADEKKLWHSHRYEVMSGQLVAPGLSGSAERELMQELVNTYGKTWQLWQVDRGDALPLGLPRLMMGFTADGQADPAMTARRDREQGTDSSREKAKRADFPARPIADGADAWQQGPPFQIDEQLLKQTPAAPKR
jgi:hypothetical protein